MRRGGVFLCCFGLRRGMFLQLLILLPPATYLWGSNLILSPTGNFLSIAKESRQRTPAETDGFWRHFFILFAAVGKKYAVGDTFLAQSTVVDKKYAAGAESVQVIMEDAAFACAGRCGRTDSRYIVFYRRTKSCFDQTVDLCSCGISWLLRRAWDSPSPMLLSPFRLFCIIELRVVFQHFAG